MVVPPSRPLIIAHRGASHWAPEHTLAAYERALVEGADGWECDVRLTRDGHLVCVHDRRLERTSNGRGAVSRAHLDQLRGLDFGSWKPDWSRRALHHAGDATGVLTLERLLELFVDCGRPLTLLVETKHPSRYRGAVERALVEQLRRFGLTRLAPEGGSSVVMMSMWPRAIRRVQRLAPGLPTAQLLVATPPPYHNGALPWNSPIAGPWIRLLRARPEYVRRAQAAGKRVFTWTVDEPDDLALAYELGVDAIITNRPARAREHGEGVS